MKKTFLLFGSWILMATAGFGQLQPGVPKIQVDRTVYDFGKTSQVESVSGVFRITNVGTGVLKVDRPQPTCGCTIASLTPDTLQPGEISELKFTLNLGRAKAVLQKNITLTSNDPANPRLNLTVRADYTPLHEFTPSTFSPAVPVGGVDSNMIFTVTRSDGKPVKILRFETSKPWITAKVEETAPNGSSARVRIVAAPNIPSGRFNDYVHFYADQTNTVSGTVYVYGRVLGEVMLSQEMLYWSVTDPARFKTNKTDALTTRRVRIHSANGKEFTLKNPQSTLKELNVQLVTVQTNKVYELIARLDDVPEQQALRGNITFETSVAAQSRIDVPVTINVFKR